MGRRSRYSRRAGIEEKRPGAGSDPASQGKRTRRTLWAAVLVIVTVLNIVLLCTYVAVHRPPSDPNGKNADDPRTAEVEELIRRYFRTWSSQDIQGYGECFRSNSSIQFIDAEGTIKEFALPEFLASQDAVFRAGQHETEVPESIDIRFESELARVVVYYKLTAGPREVFGYDHFTLAKHDGKWGIVNLVWHETKHPG